MDTFDPNETPIQVKLCGNTMDLFPRTLKAIHDLKGTFELRSRYGDYKLSVVDSLDSYKITFKDGENISEYYCSKTDGVHVRFKHKHLISFTDISMPKSIVAIVKWAIKKHVVNYPYGMLKADYLEYKQKIVMNNMESLYGKETYKRYNGAEVLIHYHPNGKVSKIHFSMRNDISIDTAITVLNYFSNHKIGNTDRIMYAIDHLAKMEA